MSDVRELYQEVILHHNRAPRNFGELEDADRSAEGHNPLCGDRLHLDLRLEDGRVADVRFRGEGCAISKASSSLMTEAVKGLSEEEARKLLAAFHAAVTGVDPPADAPELRKLAALAGVREFPARVKCAMLAWRTLEAALKGEDEVTTE